MRKLLSILTLMLCVCSGAWADSKEFLAGTSTGQFSQTTTLTNSPVTLTTNTTGGNAQDRTIWKDSKEQKEKAIQLSSSAGNDPTTKYIEISVAEGYKITGLTVRGAINSTTAGTYTAFCWSGSYSTEAGAVTGTGSLAFPGYNGTSDGANVSMTGIVDGTRTIRIYKQVKYNSSTNTIGNISGASNTPSSAPGTVNISKITVTYEAVAAVPSTIVFAPASDTEQEQGAEITLTSTGATTILYQWGSAAVDAEGDWSSATTYSEESKPEVPAYGSTNNVLSVKASNTYGDTYGSATYTIVAAKKDLTLAYSGDVTLKANETLVPATLTATDADGTVELSAISDALTFATSDATVATVTDDGIVAKTGKVGTATITATFAGNATYRATEASYTITVQTVPVVYQVVDLTQGHTWDFSQVAAEEADLIADTENWGLVDNTEHRYTNKNSLSDERMVANYKELAWTEGLYFKGSASSFRLNMNGSNNLQLVGKNLTITIKGLKAGQQITVVAKSASSSATDRYVKANKNITVVSGFASSGTADYVTSVGKVTADGDIVLESSAGINIQSIELTAYVETETATVQSYGWATYIPENNVSFEEETAYVVTDVNTTTGAVSVDNVTSVPANTPVLLKGEGTKTMTVLSETPVAPGTNMLSVSNGTANGTKVPYVLAKNSDSAGFKKWTGEVSVLNSRVVLWLDSAIAAARGFFFFDGDNNPISTGINAAHTESGMTGGEFFDLQGRKVAQPTKGLYIVNGKKVIVK